MGIDEEKRRTSRFLGCRNFMMTRSDLIVPIGEKAYENTKTKLPKFKFSLKKKEKRKLKTENCFY